MKHFILIAIVCIFNSCNNSSNDKQMPTKNSRESIGKDIVGIWELLKEKYTRTAEPYLVTPEQKQLLEIKADGTCQDDRYIKKWYLSYTDDYVVDSLSKIFFTELSDLDSNSYGEYHRKIKPYQIKVSKENNSSYLYLTSLETSATKIYIRKN